VPPKRSRRRGPRHDYRQRVNTISLTDHVVNDGIVAVVVIVGTVLIGWLRRRRDW